MLVSPTIRAAKECYPNALVSVLVREPYGSLLAADPNVHEVVEAGNARGSILDVLADYLRFAIRLRRARYDLVIDVRTGDHGAILSLLTAAPQRVGRHGDDKPIWHNWLFTKIVRNPPIGPPSVHPGADQSLRVARAIGIDTKDSTPRLYLAPVEQARAIELISQFAFAPGTRWVTANPFSRWKYKEWDGGKWSMVIDHIWDAHGISTVLVGSSDEAAACDEIAAKCRGRAFNLAGRTSLGELAAVIKMSTLHMGVDSAAPHMAAALGTPSVTIHGPSDWRAWRVVNDLQKIVTPTMHCVPCNRKGCNDTERSLCLEQLNPQAVIEMVEQLLHSLTKRNN